MTLPWLAALAADPAVPARDVVLDPDAVARRLPALLGSAAPFDLCRLERAKYRIGESVRAVYRVRSGGEQHLVAARSFANGSGRIAYAQALEAAVPAGGLNPVAHDLPIDTVWWTFPNDRRLTSLTALMSPSLLSPGAEWRSWTRSEVVQLAPERTVTVRALDADGGVVGYAKAYAPTPVSPIPELVARYELMADGFAAASLGVASPRVAASSQEHGIILQEAMPGHPWSDVGPDALPVVMHRLGEALACTHGFDTAPFEATGIHRFARLSAERAVHCAELVATGRPDVADLAQRVGERLAAAEPPDLGVDCVLHGDVHPKNALLDGDRLSMIDIDQAGLGPAAADIASLIARVQYGTMIGDWDAITARQLIRAFVESYGAHRALPDQDTIRWHVAAATVAERALRAVSRVRVEGLTHLPELLLRAEAALTDEPW